MRELLLDAETLYTRAQAHDALAKAFGFPADYGRTLDALYDLLTACPPAEPFARTRSVPTSSDTSSDSTMMRSGGIL